MTFNKSGHLNVSLVNRCFFNKICNRYLKKETIPWTLLFVDFECFSLFISCLQDDLLKILGVKHRLYEFLNTLSRKCSYVLFNKEHVKAILVEIVAQKSAENAQRTQSCMNLLVVRTCHF
jgi:hypothetical protein